MPIETRVFDVSLAPGLQVGVTVESPDGSTVRAESATCYYRGEDSTSAYCVVTIDLHLSPPVPLVASPGLYGAMAGVLLLAGLGRRRARRARPGAS
jgi:hypothetical protein